MHVAQWLAIAFYLHRMLVANHCTKIIWKWFLGEQNKGKKNENAIKPHVWATCKSFTLSSPAWFHSFTGFEFQIPGRPTAASPCEGGGKRRRGPTSNRIPPERKIFITRIWSAIGQSLEGPRGTNILEVIFPVWPARLPRCRSGCTWRCPCGGCGGGSWQPCLKEKTMD